MKKTIIALSVSLVCVLGLGAVGCGSSWLANFKSNPVAVAQQYEQTAEVVLQQAEAAWPIVLGFLPADKQAVAQTAFNDAVFSVNHAMTILNDAIQVAVDTGNAHPDFSAAMASISDAVAQVISIVKQFEGVVHPAAVDGGAPMMKLTRSSSFSETDADLDMGLATLHKISHK